MNGPNASRGCAPTADLLPELALGILGGGERAEVLAHLDRCASCREQSAEWAATADVLPMLLTEAEPPVGFEARTLERLRADRDRVPRRSRMQRLLAVAAIVAVVMIGTIATVRIIDARDAESSSDAKPVVTSAEMIGRSGHGAGAAFMTTGDDQYVFLDVDYGVKSGVYRIEVVDGANRATPIGNVSIKEGQGAWAGELPGGAGTSGPRMVRIVGADGEVFCTARFGPVAS